MIEERIDLTLLIYFYNLLSIKIEESIKYLSTKIIVRLLYRFLILSIHTGFTFYLKVTVQPIQR